MKLWYLYVRHRAFSLEQLQTDGHYTLMRELARRGLVDEATIVCDNYARPPEVLDREPQFQVLSLQGLDDLRPAPGDVIWIRGAWKPWIPWIERYAPSCWMWYYAANAGHHAWPWWDVLLWDMAAGNREGSEGKLWWHYRKTVSPEFRLLDLPEEWDVCCGASHIYDRKGQFRILPVCRRFKELTGRDLKVVMPGAFYSRERQTEAMRAEMLAGQWPNITVPGWMDRAKMVEVYNRSRWFYAATCGGQGDRCVPESGMCGCRQIIGLPKNHPPYAYEESWVTYVPPDQDDTDAIAEHLAGPDYWHSSRGEVAAYFQREAGLDIAIEYLRPLLEHCRGRAKNRESLKELL
jgi:hypothetical protein